MSKVILLDTGPLGMVTHPRGNQQASEWLARLLWQRTAVRMGNRRLRATAGAHPRNKPTADDSALDGDVILAAQALLLATSGSDVIIATTNVKHLSSLADARLWSAIE